MSRNTGFLTRGFGPMDGRSQFSIFNEDSMKCKNKKNEYNIFSKDINNYSTPGQFVLKQKFEEVKKECVPQQKKVDIFLNDEKGKVADKFNILLKTDGTVNEISNDGKSKKIGHVTEDGLIKTDKLSRFDVLFSDVPKI